MKNKIYTMLLCFLLASCGSERTFHDYARGGDTVAVPVGMQPTFNKDNITVTITDANGTIVNLPATDSAIRSVINLYPDPVSNMIVSREIHEDTAPSAYAYSNTTLISANDDKDYFQTTVFIDLPEGLAVGLAEIHISDTTGASHNSHINIIATTGGTPNTFRANIPGTSASFPLDDVMRDTLSRSTHTEVSFNANSIPYAIEANFTHDPDKTVDVGTGKAFVVNPIGYIKNLHWSDNGRNLIIIMTQSNSDLIKDMNDYKFYIAGTATNLQLVSVQGYDSSGNEMNTVSATLIHR